jgi:hypothetical protein
MAISAERAPRSKCGKMSLARIQVVVTANAPLIYATSNVDFDEDGGVI